MVEFKAYGPDRVVESGEPALLTDETDYQGSFAAPPPLANYSVGDFLWDRGSSVWLIRRSGSTTWGTTGGPHGYAPGHLYATEDVAAAQHVTGSGYFHPGGVVIYGQGSAQRPYVIVGFTAASAASWQWDPIGVTPNEVDGAIDARLSDDDPEDVATAADEGTSTDTARSDHVHELASGVVTTPKYGTQSLSGSKLQLETVSSTDANTRVLLFDTADDQIGTGQIGTVNLLDGSVTSAKLASGAAGVVIAPYSATATYSRGSNNSFVTDGGELYVYTSGSERSSNHNPGTNPQYWFRVSHGAEFINVGSGSHRYKAGTFLLVDNAIYLATTNITTPRAAAYIIANAGDNQEFLLVNGGSGGGSDLAVQEEGTEVEDATTTINFTGSGATATASSGTVTVDIPGGGVSTVAFHAGISADTAVTSSQTTWTQVLQLGSADINEGSFTIESQSDDTERVCVPDDGLYVVRAQIGAAADASTTQRFTLESRFTITPDGGAETAQDEIARQYNRGRDTDAASGATNLSGGHLAAMYDLNADDCIGVQTRTQLSAINYTVQSAVSYVEIVKQQVGAQGPQGPAGSGSGALSDDDPEAVAEIAAAGTGTEASRSDHVHAGLSWGVQIDTQIVPQANEDAISTPRISLRTSGLMHYLAFLDWTAANLERIDHLPVGGHIGLRQGTTTRVLRVEATWEASENRYQVSNVNTGILTEASSGTDTELLLTAPGGSGGGASLSDATPDALTPDQAGAAGTSADASRADHAHQMTAGTAQTIGTSNAEGSGSTVARSDHRHQGVASIATSGTGLTHSAATGTVTLTHTAHTQRALATATPEDVQDTGAVGTGTEVARADHVHQLPIDNTLQFDGSDELGVQISTVIDLLDEDIRYYSTDTTREDARQASKGIVFLDTSRYAKRIHSVEWDFEGDGVGHNYTTFFVRIDSDDDIDFVYGESETLFNVGTSGTHRFDFDSSGLRIPGSVERLGLFITRTGSDDTWETKVYRGQPASDSPRESYPDASVDFPFWRSARFASGRPEPGEHIDNYITNGEIYGYPKIRYTLELEHASLVGDGNITAAHIDSGSAANQTVLQADGSGGSAFLAVVVHGDNIVDNTIPTDKYGNETVTAGKMSSGSATDGHVATADGSGGVDYEAVEIGGVTHVESGATYNNNVITVSTTGTVRGGDGILFAVPSPFGTDATQAVSLEIDGQANSEFPLHDRNGDALHEDDLTVDAVYIAISDADSWDILVLPDETSAGGGASLSDATPDSLQPDQTGSAGTATDASRADHAHAIASSTPVGLGTSNQEGSFTSFARTNHVHRAFDSTLPSAHGIGQSGAAGTSTMAARRDHVHAIPVGVPVAVGTANAEGTATTAARSDHVHEGDGAGGAFDLHDDVATAISTLDDNDRFVVSDENLSGDPNRYVTLAAVAAKLAGTGLTASAGVLSASGSDLAVQEEGTSVATAATTINFTGAGATATATGGVVTVDIPGGGGDAATDYARTLIGTSTSMGTTVVTLNLSEAIEDGELIEILWLASAGGRNYGASLVTADAILDLTAQAATPGSVSGAMQFKIGDTATGLSTFGHGSGFLWFIDTDSIYLANGRQRPMVAEVYKLTPPAGGGSSPGNEMEDSSITTTGNFDETTIDVPSTTWGFVNFRGHRRVSPWRVAPILGGRP